MSAYIPQPLAYTICLIQFYAAAISPPSSDLLGPAISQGIVELGARMSRPALVSIHPSSAADLNSLMLTGHNEPSTVLAKASEPGIVETILARPGEFVARGTPLARLSTFELEEERQLLGAELDVARAELSLARAQERPILNEQLRFLQLAKFGASAADSELGPEPLTPSVVLPGGEIEELAAAAKTATLHARVIALESNLAALNQRIASATIYAPVSGHVLRTANRGHRVDDVTTDPVASLVQGSYFFVRFAAPSGPFSARVGDRIRLLSTGTPGPVCHVVEIEADDHVRVGCESEHSVTFYPEEVTAELMPDQDAWVVPRDAVRNLDSSQDAGFVLIATSAGPRMIAVSILRRAGKDAVIVEGISADDTVLVERRIWRVPAFVERLGIRDVIF